MVRVGVEKSLIQCSFLAVILNLYTEGCCNRGALSLEQTWNLPSHRSHVTLGPYPIIIPNRKGDRLTDQPLEHEDVAICS